MLYTAVLIALRCLKQVFSMDSKGTAATAPSKSFPDFQRVWKGTTSIITYNPNGFPRDLEPYCIGGIVHTATKCCEDLYRNVKYRGKPVRVEAWKVMTYGPLTPVFQESRPNRKGVTFWCKRIPEQNEVIQLNDLQLDPVAPFDYWGNWVMICDEVEGLEVRIEGLWPLNSGFCDPLGTFKESLPSSSATSSSAKIKNQFVQSRSTMLTQHFDPSDTGRMICLEFDNSNP